jgi:tetratricopeptide (TPR) repeat protein
MNTRILPFLFMLLCVGVYGQQPPSIPALLQKLNTAKDEEKPVIYKEIGVLYISRDQFDSAIYYSNEALKIAISINDVKAVGDAYNNIGLIYRVQSKYEAAMENLVKALGVYEANNFYKESAKTLSSVSYIYFMQNKADEAIRGFQKAAAISKRERDTTFLTSLYTSLCEVYLGADSLKAARKYIDSAEILLSSQSQIQPASPGEAMRLVSVKLQLNKIKSGVYTMEGNYKAAINLLKQNLEQINSSNGSAYEKFDLAKGLANNYAEAGRFDSALYYSGQAVASLPPDRLPVTAAYIHDFRARIYSKMGQFKQAYSEQVLFKRINDSLVNEKAGQYVAELETKYETEKKDARITTLNRQKKSQRTITALAIGASAIALGFVGFAYRSKRLQRKLFSQKEALLKKEQEAEKVVLQHKMSELEQMALRAQMNPHFIFNSLNSVQHFVMRHDVEGVNKYLGAFAHLVRQTLHNSGQPLISLNEEVKYLDTYLSLEKMKSNNRFNYTITVNDDIDGTATLIPGMILQPFVENSIKHGVAYKEAGDGEIKITVSKNGQLQCRIEDNGGGRKAALPKPTGDEYQSKGMSITLKRIETINKIYGTAIDARVEDITDAGGEVAGTRVTVHFPVNLE